MAPHFSVVNFSVEFWGGRLPPQGRRSLGHSEVRTTEIYTVLAKAMHTLDPAQLDEFSSGVQTKAAAKATFAPLATLITELGTEVTAYHALRVAAANADATAKSTAAALEAGRPDLENVMTNFANAVEGLDGVTEADILAIDLKLRSAATPIGIPAQVSGFDATASETPGGIDLSGTPVRGAVAYIYECATYDTPRTWSQIKLGTKASHDARGLTSGTLYVFRMRAVGAAGEGPWSDEAVMRAP